MAATLGVNLPSMEGSDANFVDILQSRWMGEQLLSTQFKFRIRRWRFGVEQDKFDTLYNYLDKRNQDKALKALFKIFKCSKDLKSKIILVSCETKSPSLSSQVVEKSLVLLEKFVMEKGRTRGGAKALFAEARLTDSRKEVDSAQDSLRKFAEENRNYSVSADPAVRLNGLRLEAELRLRQQILTTLALSYEQALMEEKNDVPIVNVLDHANLPIEKSSPTRSIYVIAGFLVVLIGMLCWQHRASLEAFLHAE